MKQLLQAAALLAVLSSCRGKELTMRLCCKQGEMVVRDGCSGGDSWNIDCERKFMLEDYNFTGDGITTKDTPGYTWRLGDDEFCVGQMVNNKTGTSVITNISLVCFSDQPKSSGGGTNTIRIYGILVLVSVAFLIITMWVYFLLPQLRDLQGKCIMCQSGCLALAYLNLGIMQLGTISNSSILVSNCSVNSFMMYFWFIAMFFWSTVVSINIFRSVSQYKYMHRTESRQFTYYSAYAWGASGVFLLVAIVTNYVEGTHLKPQFGHYDNMCWFASVAETWTFFYGPIAVLIGINVIMFLLASRVLWTNPTSRHEVNIMGTLKYRFLLYLKLFVITGISWIFEVVGFANVNKSLLIWKIADIFNCLQGVLFFLLLVVFRRRALKGLEERGIKLCGLIPLLLRCFNEDKESDLIVESEEQEHEQHVEAHFDVNLN